MDILRKQKGSRVRRLTKEQIRRKALDLRRLYNIADGYVDVTDLIELCMSQSRFRFHIVNDEELPGIAAFSSPQDHYMEIAESIYNKAYNNDPKARFIIAHEIGHIHIGHSTPLQWATTENICRHPLDDSEYQADIYAVELLLPITGVIKCKNPRHVSEKYVVEQTVAFDRWIEIQNEGLF